MEGGKLLGKGSYGCGFTTASACDDKQKNSKLKKTLMTEEKIVSKRFFYRSNFREEQELIGIVKKLDPRHTFTVPIHMVCTASKNIDEDRHLCKRNDVSDIGVQIVMGYGGEKIDSRFLPISDDVMVGMWKGMPKILEGLKRLHSHGYIHCDLKYDNILFDVQKRKFNLIDFGLSSPIEEIGLLDFKHKTSNYYWYPFEYYLINTLYHYVLNSPYMRTVEYLKTLTYDDMLFLFEKDFSRSAFVFPYYVQHYHDVNLVDIAMYVTKCFVNCFTAKGKRAGTMLSSIDIKNATHKTIADMSMGYDIFGFGVVLLQYLDQTKVFFKSLGTDAKLNFGRILRLGILLCHPDIRKRSSCYSVKDNIKMIENISTKEILHSISYVLKPYFISFDSMYNDDDISNILTHNKIDSSHDRIKNREIFKNEFTPSYYDLSVNMPTSTSTSMSHERINNNITKKHK